MKQGQICTNLAYEYKNSTIDNTAKYKHLNVYKPEIANREHYYCHQFTD